MTMNIAFTQAAIDKLPPAEPGKRYYCSDKNSILRLAVTDRSAKSFFITATIAGRTKRVVLGAYPTLKIEAARKLAKGRAAAAAEGRDPVQEKRAANTRDSLTLRIALDEFLAKRRVKAGAFAMKESTKADYKRRIKRTFRAYMDRPLLAITEQVIRAANEQTSSNAAAMRSLSSLFNWALSAHREIVKTNPVSILRHERTRFTAPRKTNHIEAPRLGAFLAAVDKLPAAERAFITLLTFTGIRVSEALGLTWADIDLKAATMRLIDTKNRTDALLPLPAPVVALLKPLKQDDGRVFSITRNGAGVFKSLDFKGSDGKHITAHDLRRTFMTIGGGLENLNQLQLKRLANHVSQEHDVTAGYVQRSLESMRRASLLVEREMLALAQRRALKVA